jgi:hypothetical protein
LGRVVDCWEIKRPSILSFSKKKQYHDFVGILINQHLKDALLLLPGESSRMGSFVELSVGYVPMLGDIDRTEVNRAHSNREYLLQPWRPP